ncbi:Nif11-like leader peptide family RiPP precursor [Synechococcus sp. UW179A]|uniref:Nif11-like leader peptide family RiPP precursor n=1 Tax=Synechococcus sp. UW179A TaxID=2575510 RepID=UPI000E0F1F90|nr:Nif11-like leader peptide family RiPP precursor [Synechococcus sp. UW179A]
MQEDQLKKFLTHVKGNKALQDELKSGKNAQHFLDVAEKNGYQLPMDGIAELSAAELEIIAGGGNGCACRTRGQCILTGAAYPH